MSILDIREFRGYRGTRKKYTDALISSDDWKFSDGEDEYFGHGIYFFEEDHTEAYNFVKYTKEYEENEISLIQAKISCSRETILDFFNGQVYDDYIKLLVDEINERFKGYKNIPKIEIPFDCGLINMVCEKDGYILVRGPHQPKYRPIYRLAIELVEEDFTRIKPTHIQLCVRNRDIIKKYLVCCA